MGGAQKKNIYRIHFGTTLNRISLPTLLPNTHVKRCKNRFRFCTYLVDNIVRRKRHDYAEVRSVGGEAVLQSQALGQSACSQTSVEVVAFCSELHKNVEVGGIAAASSECLA